MELNCWLTAMLRSIQCDEVHPICGNCERYKASCIYDHLALKSQVRWANDQGKSDCVKVEGASNSISQPKAPDELESAEQHKQHLLELKLLHNYNVKLCYTLMVDTPTAEDAWIRMAPQIGFENEALLHSIYAVSALHIADTDPDVLGGREEAIDTHSRYLGMAIHEHQHDIRTLNEKNFDAACLTSAFLRMHAFVQLRSRCLDPYEPPVSWLLMTRGAMDVFKTSYRWMHDHDDAIAARLTKRMPFVFDDEAKFAPKNRQDLLYLLHRDDEDVRTEVWGAEDRLAYETTLSYIGGLKMEMNNTASYSDLCRKLIIFPFLVHSRYFELVTQQKPRALMILGHYFALLARFRSHWWVGDSGRRELHALYTALPDKWRNFLSEPMKFVEDEYAET